MSGSWTRFAIKTTDIPVSKYIEDHLNNWIECADLSLPHDDRSLGGSSLKVEECVTRAQCRRHRHLIVHLQSTVIEPQVFM